MKRTATWLRREVCKRCGYVWDVAIYHDDDNYLWSWSTVDKWECPSKSCHKTYVPWVHCAAAHQRIGVFVHDMRGNLIPDACDWDLTIERVRVTFLHGTAPQKEAGHG